MNKAKLKLLWSRWYVKATVATVVVAAVLGAFVSSILAHSWALHIFTCCDLYSAFGRRLTTETVVLLFTLAGGIVGFIIALVVVLFGYFGFRRFSKKLRLAKLKLLWRRWSIKAAVTAVVVVALLAVVLYVALKPMYTADEVTKKMQGYLSGKVFAAIPFSTTDYTLGLISPATNCYEIANGEVWKGLATPHYISYRKAWLITTEGRRADGLVMTWVFDERTGTIASSNPLC